MYETFKMFYSFGVGKDFLNKTQKIMILRTQKVTTVKLTKTFIKGHLSKMKDKPQVRKRYLQIKYQQRISNKITGSFSPY